MHMLYELRDMLCEELENVTMQGELSAGSLDIVDKLTHSIKSIDTIIAMEEAGYSYENSGANSGANSGRYSNDGYSSRGGYSRGYSNARGRGRNAKRDSMGRYSSASYDGGNSGRSSYRGYSRADAKEELVEQLKELEMSTQDSETKQMIQKFMRQAEED